MKFIYYIMLFISVDAADVTKHNKFTRVQRVDQQDLASYKLNSNTGTRSSFECAIQCEKEGCLSFSYTKLDKRCDTYSKRLDEDQNAGASMSTIYFSKGSNICQGVPQGSPSGQYQIRSKDGSSMNLFCDMDAAEGPWAVIHSRTLGNVDFYRNWADYKNGFGNLNEDFWIGNDIIHTLTTTPSILRVELETWKGLRGYAQYSSFEVANEAQNYRINVQGFSGNVSRNGMEYGNGFGFTTYDRVNDGRDATTRSCAVERHSAWWHDRCTLTNLNGVYHQEDGYDWVAMSWIDFPHPDRSFTPLRKAKMMIRWIE